MAWHPQKKHYSSIKPRALSRFFRWFSATSRLVPFSALVIVVLGLGYLAFINWTSTLGLEIRELEKSRSELLESKERLEVRAAELQSLAGLGTSNDLLHFTKPVTVRYVTFGGTKGPLAVRP